MQIPSYSPLSKDLGIYAGCVKPIATRDLAHILSLTRPVWERARGKRIFLTGATGFFGAWLLESLAYCNRELHLETSATVLCRNPEAAVARMPHLGGETSIRFVAGDVRSFDFPDQSFDFVIHAAAASSGAEAAQPLNLLTTLVRGTERVLEFAKARNTEAFLFVSSGAVYGPQPENLGHIPENYRGGPDWVDPNAAYAEGKRVAEQMCSIYACNSEIQFSIARCFAFVGPHLPLDRHFAIGNFIGDALAGKNISIRGDGTPMRSYLYAADLAIWLWTLLLAKSEHRATPSILNVGSGDAISIGDLATTVVEELNPSLTIELAAKPAAGAPLRQYVPDVTEAEARLGLRKTIGLREAIRRTADWYS
jgi:nucleoside-diphosphate-sugar epimerase